jgi:hypothetical protein
VQGHRRTEPEAAILADRSPEVYVDAFEDDAVSVTVHYWLDDPSRRDVHAARSRYARALKRRREDADVPVSLPSEYALHGRLEIENRFSLPRRGWSCDTIVGASGQGCLPSGGCTCTVNTQCVADRTPPQ